MRSAETMQKANASNNPVLLQVDYKEGYGASAYTFDATKNEALILGIYLEYSEY